MWIRVLSAVALTALSVPSFAATAGVDGVTAGTGSFLVAGTKTPFVPRGFNSIGILYPAQYADVLCTNMSAANKQSLDASEIRMTAQTSAQFEAMKGKWYANSVRFQLSQGALVYEKQHHLDAYTRMVAAVASEARKQGLVTFLSMQTESRGCTPLLANGKLRKLPDQLTEQAWSQLLPALHLDRGIVLEIFNEPKTVAACGKAGWTAWATGCHPGTEEGMLTVGLYLRRLAPGNVLLFDADNNGGSFKDFVPPPNMPTNSAYTVHPYFFADGPAHWDKRFGDLQASGHTIVVTEWDGDAECRQHGPQIALAKELIQSYQPAHHIGLMLMAWDSPQGGQLVDQTTHAPLDSSPKCSFTGATLALDLFRKQAHGR